MKINRSVKSISRYRIGGFKRVTKSLFFYNRSEELKKKYHNIVAWVLLVDDAELPMHHVLEISFYRKYARAVNEWGKMWTEKTPPKNAEERKKLSIYGRQKHPSLLQILDDRILESLNIRRHTHWRVKSVIGWTHGISKFRRSVLSSRVETTTKKGRRKYASYRR
jgi:hypothetical protein